MVQERIVCYQEFPILPERRKAAFETQREHEREKHRADKDQPH